MTAPLLAPVPWHLGGLHPYEQMLVMVLAFGPFVVLGVVVALQRRRALAEEQAEADAEVEAETEEAGDDGRGGAGPPRG